MCRNAKWVFEWFKILFWELQDGRAPVCHSQSSSIVGEKKDRERFQHLLSWFLTICWTVLSMCLVLTPSVLAFYFHHSHLISLEHAEVVTDETREGKDLAWPGTGQADEAGHFESLGRDHSFICIKFCFLLFLKLVPSVVYGGHTLNIPYTICGHAISYKVKVQYWGWKKSFHSR